MEGCKHEKTIVITKEETYPVLGEPITIMARVKVCRLCGEDLFDYYLDTNNLKLAYSKYNLLHPDNKIKC